MKFYRTVLGLFLSFQLISVRAQLNKELPLDTVSISSIEQFPGAAKGWSEKERIMVNRNTGDLKLSKGKGVLVYEGNKDKTTAKIKAFDHGNIDFETQFMLAPDAEASLLFQGVYSIYLNDSWGKKNISYKDCGGVSISEDPATAEKNLKRVPLSNGCHAPGLWQKIEVSFAAPVFDSKGKKIKNARFDKIILNGAVIHENIELPVNGIQENAIAPFVLKGMKGAVAFKNISYLTVTDQPLKLRDIKYKYLTGKMETFPDFTTSKIEKTGNLEALSWQPTTTNEDFAFEYSGVIDIPATNLYEFQTVTLGGGRLIIDGKKVVEHSSDIDHEGNMDRKDIGAATLTLEKGSHPFVFTYYRNTWAPVPVLGVFVQGRGGYRQALHDEKSFPPEDAVSRITIKTAGETVIQRSFLLFNGKRKTHCVSVGSPTGIHYSYDLSNGSLMQIWKGPFADATGMWHVRGNQILRPLSSPLIFNDEPQFIRSGQSEPAAADYKWKGYDLKAEGGPVFKYQIAGLNVVDALYPEEEGKILTRKLNITGSEADAGFRVVKAKKIERLSKGDYYVNDGEYFIRFNSSGQPDIKETARGVELIIALKKGTDSEINYSIIR